MRLLIATPLYPPESGGPATYAKLLEEGMPGEGVDVTVVKFSDVRSYPKLARHIAYFWKVFSAAKRADIVLALDPVSVGLPALWAAHLRGKPFIVKIVGDYAWEQGVQRFGIEDSLDAFVRRGRVPFPVAVMRAVETHVAKIARQVIVPSRYLKQIVHVWGVPEKCIEIVHNAIELEEGGTVPHAAAALPRPRIVSVGRLVPWKGVAGVIDAVAGLHARANAEPSLIVVGDGPERERLESVARQALGERALFTGALAHADALAVMRDADVFVLNSSYEGLSHVLIEALMLGKAVIATDAGGNAELITHGENGILIPSGDTHALSRALGQLLGDDRERERLGAGALRAGEKFSLAAMYARTAQLLSRTAGL